jgi:hypothetical protein
MADPIVQTERFDAGSGTEWYVVPQLSDSGDELRSKTMKSGYVVGKLTSASLQGYGYDIDQRINMGELEDGTRIAGSTAPQSLPDTANVAQSPRKPINVKNATITTMRVSGDCTGAATMDRVDQICYEQSIQGARR